VEREALGPSLAITHLVEAAIAPPHHIRDLATAHQPAVARTNIIIVDRLVGEEALSGKAFPSFGFECTQSCLLWQCVSVMDLARRLYILLSVSVEITMPQTNFGVGADHGRLATAHLPNTARSQRRTGELIILLQDVLFSGSRPSAFQDRHVMNSKGQYIYKTQNFWKRYKLLNIFSASVSLFLTLV
jgi:hypothetical protein